MDEPKLVTCFDCESTGACQCDEEDAVTDADGREETEANRGEGVLTSEQVSDLRDRSWYDLHRADVESALHSHEAMRQRVVALEEALQRIIETEGIPGFADRHRAASRKMREIARRALDEQKELSRDPAE